MIKAIIIIVFSIGLSVGRSRKRLYENSGESLVRSKITKYFNTPSYHLLNNITLPVFDGTTQIDHVLVSTSGVFVIEKKQYSGWVFGCERSKKWTQVIFRKKSFFQNPLHQNYKHKKLVEKILDFLPESAIHSVVVF